MMQQKSMIYQGENLSNTSVYLWYGRPMANAIGEPEIPFCKVNVQEKKSLLGRNANLNEMQVRGYISCTNSCLMTYKCAESLEKQSLKFLPRWS